MVAEMIEKPLTEAQRLVERLESEFALSPAEIAQQTRIKAQTIHDIKRRTNTGNLQLRFLRPLIHALESNGNPLGNAGRSDPLFSNPAPSNPEPLAEPFGAGFAVNAAEPEPVERKGFGARTMDSLRAAMLGDASAIPAPNMTAPSRKRSDGGDAKQSFVEIMTPFTAMVMVLSASWAIRDPYKPCAPTVDEAQAMVQPIIRRLAHELDIKGRLSENSIDTLTILLATANYGMRAQGTWKQIHAMEVERARSNNRPTAYSGAYSGPDAAALAGSGGGPTGGPVYAAPSPADAGAGAGVPDASAPLPFWRGGTGRSRQAVSAAGRGASGGADSGQQRQSDALIDQLLAQDHAGRVRLGL